MISVYQLKPKFQQLLRPLLHWMYGRGITANQITGGAIFLSLVIGLCFWFATDNKWLFLALPSGLLLRMGLNALDGMMATAYDQQSKRGEMLNEIGDVISDIFIYFPLLIHEQSNWLLVVVFLVMSLLNEFAGILGKVISGERRYEGPMGKSDRALAIGMYGLLAFFSLTSATWTYWALLAIIGLLMFSTYLRLKNALK